MKTYQVTITHVVTVRAKDETQIHEAFNATRGPGESSLHVAEILRTPERRVIIREDELGAYMWCDYALERERKEIERMVEQHGAWGYVCEERTVADGPWEHVDSCWGFIGGFVNHRSMLRDMREHMPKEFRDIEPEEDTE